MITSNQIVKRLVSEDFSEEILSNVMAVLEMRPVMKKSTAGFLTEKEACDYCGNISRSTLWHWKRRGLKSYKLGGRCLYSPADLDRFIYSADPVDTAEKVEG